METRTFLVGGAVRDAILGQESKDLDFAVEAPSFEAMRDMVVAEGHRIVDERPEFLTIRAVVGKDHPLREVTNAVDFVMCRKDAATGDGRRPDFVEPGTILDDLARRDFTVNALAQDVATGEILDPFGGGEDLHRGILRFVGEPEDRIREDGLRVLRGFRFMVTKDLVAAPRTMDALAGPVATEMLHAVSVERIREELNKMLRADPMRTLNLLNEEMRAHRPAIFRDGLRLDATLKA